MRGREIIVWRTPRRSWETMESRALPVLVQVDFEVFGDLQGVSFVQHAKTLADRIGVRGWIKLTFYGTAIGQIQGEKEKVDEMALWLRHTGCPRSRIHYVDFQNWRVTDGFEYRKFSARHAKTLADRIGVRGWIKLTFYGTAIGQIQGEKEKVDEMALWLRHTGCPRSRIHYVDFQNWRVTDGFEYRKFSARV